MNDNIENDSEETIIVKKPRKPRVKKNSDLEIDSIKNDYEESLKDTDKIVNNQQEIIVKNIENDDLSNVSFNEENNMGNVVEVKKKIVREITMKEEDLISKLEAADFMDEKLEEEMEVKKVKRGKSKIPEINIVRKIPDVNIGLTTEEAQDRIAMGLHNEVKQGSSKTVSNIILGNIFTFFNIITICIAGWLISVNSYKDCFFILIVIMNLVIGILQEIKAKKTIDRLSLISAPIANVIRDKMETDIPISEIVVDDILMLTLGKQICCDAILLEGNIEVDESSLTGESDAILKKPGDVLFSGSFVISGTCKAVADKVGNNAYIQTLTSQAKKYIKPKSDLLKSLTFLIRFIAVIIIPIGAALYFLQTNQTNAEYQEIVRKTCGAVIGMIPSGLFLLTSVTLAVGVLRLSKINTLVQELYCIEMLARVNVLCLDKTGTITDGTMNVHDIVEYPNDLGMPIKHAIVSFLSVMNDDNMTSKAMVEKFGKGKKFKYSKTIPFSSSRKFSAVQYDRHGVFALGAPEILLKNNYGLVEEDVRKYAELGLRVLVFANCKGEIIEDDITKELVPVCLVLIEDTIRKEAITTINYFNTHNVAIKVISGDNPITVSRIAERAGVVGAENYINLDGMSDREVVRVAGKYTVFGRVSPAQKKLIIQTLKKEKNTVAMTGDGVNDILALREADCSIAMASGSEAARNVSHLVLLDSNFASMPKVVNEGRRVINNVQRVSILFLTKTIFSFMLAIIALTNNGQYPISPSQLIMIDFLVIGVPSFFLALEANTAQVKGRFIFNVLKSAIPGALTVVIMTLVIYGLKNTLQMNSHQAPTLIVISATFTCMMVLKKVSTPFNSMRRILFSSMFVGFLICVFFLSMFFDFSPFWDMPKYFINGAVVEPLKVPQIILLVCLLQASSSMIDILTYIVPWTKKQINYIVNKVTQI